MADARTIERARGALLRTLEDGLHTLGAQFIALGTELQDETQDEVKRAAYLMSESGRAVWSGIWSCDATIANETLTAYDAIVQKTEAGEEAKYSIAFERKHWNGDMGVEHLENLQGVP